MKKSLIPVLILSLLFSLTGCFVARQSSAQPQDQYIDPLSQYNPYGDYYRQDSYILPDSCSRYLSWHDISSLSAEELYLAEQEICARYGQTFADSYLNEYFTSQSWYSPTGSDVTDQLSEYASTNLDLLAVTRAKLDGSLYNWDNPYLNLCYNDYLFSDSSSRQLGAYELQGLTSKQLVIARNEIFARHGYIFSDPDLRMYFLSKPWYVPTTPSSRFDYGCLSSLEAANVELIQAAENGEFGTVPGDNTGNNNSGNTSGNNNSGTNTNPGSNVNQQDQYTYIWTNGHTTYCYHIPYVNLPTAGNINQEMYDDCYKLLQDNVFTDSGSILLWSMAYSVNRYGDIVSVLVYCKQDWGCDVILVYNFSASTGQKVSDSELYAAFGLSTAEAQDTIYTAISNYWDNANSNWINTEHYAFSQQQRERSLQAENIAKWHPYISDSGTLCFTGPIYSVAGADYYEHLLDQSGTVQPSPTCYIH